MTIYTNPYEWIWRNLGIMTDENGYPSWTGTFGGISTGIGVGAGAGTVAGVALSLGLLYVGYKVLSKGRF